MHNCNGLLSLSHNWQEWLLKLWRLVDCKEGQPRRQQACLEDLGKQIYWVVSVRYTSICKLDYRTLDEYILDMINQSSRKKEKREEGSMMNSFHTFPVQIPTTLLSVRKVFLFPVRMCFIGKHVLSQWGYKYSVRKWFIDEVRVLSQYMGFTVEMCRVVTDSDYNGPCLYNWQSMILNN
jgi:hypothetical protein